MQVPIVLTHYATWREDSDLKYLRGVKLVNHITRILEFCGAEVDVSDKLMSGMQTQSRNEFGMVCCEECDPEAACPVSSEPQVSKNPQNPPQLSVMPCTPADAASCCVVNEECGKGHVEPKCDNMMREKTPWIEGSLHAPSKRQADCRIKALGVSSENKYVMCAPHNEEMTRETQAPHSCVSERLELSEKDNTERQANEVKKEGHSADKTQDASHKQQAIKPSEVKKFVITDSMKGVQDTGWVYQYFGVVDAKTGRKWDGSVSEYCR